ncbi:hypothetical protein C2S52_015321 [Perilla frutescens var. hirtella]|nr:hypothetical protein C2S52_015321 [Perilla frutescens var. hirtella]
MVAEAKDQTAGASQDASGVVCSQSVAAQANRNGYAPKVRKPYTITKQRERWTEEEHQRFVEALKLYGRAWRQIEEHVGSKTAIQIRSHAQKFFAKVTRDSSADAEGSSSPIEIPPPRPKKKPLHPYPRKTVDRANMEVTVSHQLEGLSDDVSVAKRENYSPTSVFSAIGSDNLESTVAEMHKSRVSPASCATDLSANLFTENDNEASNTPSKEERGFHLSMKISSASVPDNKSTMKLELFPQETESTLDSPYTVEPYTSIKLFGKTVVVRDTPKQSLEVVEKSKSSLCGGVNKKSESNSEGVVMELGSDKLDFSQDGFGFVSDNATPRMPPHPVANIYCHMENMFALPWYTWFNSPIYPYSSSFGKTAAEKAGDSTLKEEENPREGSLVGSNSGSTSGVNVDSRNSKHLSSPGKESVKGFVPYKRCLAERDDKSSISLLEGRESQRARVCS